jgi:diaminopimelate decarboxylase
MDPGRQGWPPASVRNQWIMDAFTYRNGALHAEGVAVDALAAKYGTPLYVYSRAHLRDQYRALVSAFKELSPLVCYSVKVNSNLAVIKTFVDEGAGADVVSGGELIRARRAGVDPTRIVFAGVGKTEEEIGQALQENILFFTVESEPELERISRCANRLSAVGRVALRVNPDVDPQTHQYISTGKKENKFGLDLRRARKAYRHAAKLPNLEVVGLHMHIGSQILSPAPFLEAVKKVAPLCRELKQEFPKFRHLDLGGGLGIRYKPGQRPLDPAALARGLVPLLKPLELNILMEPGRYLVGNGGLLVTRVQYVKEGPSKRFVIVDAAMNDLIRPPLYEAHHEILSAKETEHRLYGDVVGPVCESADFFALDRAVPLVHPDDLLAIHSAGAYGFSMASNYNSRPRAAEVMVHGDQHALIRARETVDDLLRGESIPDWS